MGVVSDGELDEGWAQISFTVSPFGQLNYPVTISPVPECIIGNIQTLHIDSLTHGVWAIMVGGAKWKLLERPVPTNMVN